MEMKRAFSKITIKNFNDETREFSGIATTPTPDRYGDIVEPKGAVFSLPVPFLWQHQHDQPIGEITSAKVHKNGIDISGRVMTASDSKTLIERLDEAWESMKIGLVRGLSIGFSSLEEAQIKDSWSYRFIKWEWLELSAVTIPANAEATLANIKSMDQRLRVASGQRKNAVYLDGNPRRVCRPGAVYLGTSNLKTKE